jgi:hypothetical protein
MDDSSQVVVEMVQRWITNAAALPSSLRGPHIRRAKEWFDSELRKMPCPVCNEVATINVDVRDEQVCVSSRCCCPTLKAVIEPYLKQYKGVQIQVMAYSELE